MQDKIKAQLRAKFPGVNLSKSRLDAIADKLATKITDEAEIDAKLDELNDLYPFADIAKNDDRQRTQQAKPAQPTAAKTEKEESNEPDIMSMFKAMQEKLDNMEKEKQAAALREQLHAKAAEKKLPKELLKGRTIDSEEQLDQLLTEIEADFTAIKQSVVNEGLKSTGAPISGTSTLRTDSVDKDIEAWAKKD